MSRIAESAYGDTPAPYPKSPGFKEPTTSRDAARKFAGHARTLRDDVLTVIIAAGPTGATADEVADKLRQSVLAVRPRVSELREQKQIERHATLRRKNGSGMSAAVWVRR